MLEALLSAELYRVIFNQMLIPAVLTDRGFSLFLDVNLAAARLLGYSVSESLCCHPRQIFPHLAVENLPQIPFETSLISASGPLQVEMTAVSCKPCFAFFFRPLPAQQLQAENLRLQAINQRQRELIANLSHEIRTPLTAILGWPEILLDEPGLPERVYQAARSIEKEGRLLFALMEDLMDLSQIEAGQMRLDIRLENLSELLLNALEMVQEKSREKQQHLELILPETELWVPMDPLRLMQVMLNLLSNAIKFTPAGGQIRVRAEQLAQAVYVWIEDSGMGVTAADRERIFQRFARAAEAEVFEGAGIGLSLVQKYIELHGGRIGVESEQGKGATFWFSLPLNTSP